jgi:large subunit ribosomal protein L23
MNQEKIYQTLLGPVITEKSTLVSEYNQVIFRVQLNAAKPQIKQAVEQLFSVKVKAVNTMRVKGKTKRFRGIAGKRPDWKKAIVTLEDGQSIDVLGGV